MIRLKPDKRRRKPRNEPLYTAITKRARHKRLRQDNTLTLHTSVAIHVYQAEVKWNKHTRPNSLDIKYYDLVVPSDSVTSTGRWLTAAASIQPCWVMSSLVMWLTQSVPPTSITYGAPALLFVPVDMQTR